MNYIFDVLLNFSDVHNFYEFYEWNKNDFMVVAEKIPIYRIQHQQMIEITSCVIQVNKDLLDEIFDKTITDKGIIHYCCLITDLERVIALKLGEDGLLVEKSSLLIDEEEVVIEESKEFLESSFLYDIICKCQIKELITREEEKIKKELLREIKRLYDLKIYDEIDYLYHEIHSKNKNINDMYFDLINTIQNNHTDCYQKLNKIIKMVKNINYSK